MQGLVEEDGAEHRDEDDDERAEHGHVQRPPLPQAPRHEREREPGRHDALQKSIKKRSIRSMSSRWILDEQSRTDSIDHRVGRRVEPDIEAKPPVRRVPVEAEREQRGLERAGEAHQRGDGVVAREHLPDVRLDGQPDGVAEAAGDGEERAHDTGGGGRPVAVTAVGGVSEPEPGRAREAVREPDLRAPVEGDEHRAAEADQRARQLRSPAGLAELHRLLPGQDRDDERGLGSEVAESGDDGRRVRQLHGKHEQVLVYSNSAFVSTKRLYSKCMQFLSKIGAVRGIAIFFSGRRHMSKYCI